MKTLTLSALAVAALGGAALIALSPAAFADGGGWGGRHGGMMGGMMGGMGPMGGPMRMFQAFDTDGDGRLTQAEIDAKVDGEYASADKDGQGGVTLQEFEPWFWAQHREMMVRAFQRFDSDGDGSITKEEVTDVTGGIVRRMDRNGDEALTPDDRGRRGDRGWRGGHGGRHEGRGWWRGGDEEGPGRGMMGPGEGPGPDGETPPPPAQ
jgi:hypothetical protein